MWKISFSLGSSKLRIVTIYSLGTIGVRGIAGTKYSQPEVVDVLVFHSAGSDCIKKRNRGASRLQIQ